MVQINWKWSRIRQQVDAISSHGIHRFRKCQKKTQAAQAPQTIEPNLNWIHIELKWNETVRPIFNGCHTSKLDEVREYVCRVFLMEMILIGTFQRTNQIKKKMCATNKLLGSRCGIAAINQRWKWIHSDQNFMFFTQWKYHFFDLIQPKSTLVFTKCYIVQTEREWSKELIHLPFGY